jgi:hypothetical protein
MSGKRQREQRRKERIMEDKSAEMFERVESWSLDPGSMLNVEYYRCSMDTVHDDSCVPIDDENNARMFGDAGNLVACETLDKWDVLIHHENFKWHQLGLDQHNIGGNTFMLANQVQAIVEVLVEELGVSQEKLNEYFKPVMLGNMQAVREKIAVEVAEVKRQQIIARTLPTPTNLPGIPDIFGPNGRRIN